MSLETVAICIAWSIVPITFGCYFWWVKKWTVFGLLLLLSGYCLGAYAGIQLQGLSAVPETVSTVWQNQARYVSLWIGIPYFLFVLFRVIGLWGRQPTRAYLCIASLLVLVLGVNLTLGFFNPLG